MRLSSISNFTFKSRIIDSHAHIGQWFDKKYGAENLDTFTRQPLKNGDVIEKMIVSNLSCIDSGADSDEIQGNLEMLEVSRTNSKIIPLAVCNPKSGSIENIKRLFDENPNQFVGLKFHPDGHQIMATDELLEPYLEFAKDNNLPCLFHCGIAWENGDLVDEEKRFSSPEKIYEMAKKIHNAPVILAHLGAGGKKVHNQAIDVLLESIEKNDANLYVDISWVDIDDPKKPTIVELIKRLKSSTEPDSIKRVLFGSDAPIGEFDTGKKELNGKEFYEKTVVDIKNAIVANFEDEADEIIDKIFYQNAKELFNLA